MTGSRSSCSSTSPHGRSYPIDCPRCGLDGVENDLVNHRCPADGKTEAERVSSSMSILGTRLGLAIEAQILGRMADGTADLA